MDEIIERLVVLNVAVAACFGMPLDHGRRWIADNNLQTALSLQEAALLQGGGEVDQEAIQLEVEAIWALAWVLSLGEDLDPGAVCPDDLVTRVPNLREAEPVTTWRDRLRPTLRSADDVMGELDLHYCMTWGLAEANLRQQAPPGAVPQYAIWQRRRALEFAVAERQWTHEEWDHIDLST